MSYRSVEDVLAEADARGLRRALFVTAVLLEMEAVRGHRETAHKTGGFQDDGTLRDQIGD